ncbi:MAG: glycosyltransferase family 4 protein, partial [Vicinamibacterales bacterium]
FESHGLAPVVGGSLGSLLSTARSAAQRKQRRLWAREQTVWRRAEGYVAITEILAAELASHFGTRELVRVIVDGVRLEPGRAFAPSDPADAPTLGYAGHLYPWKGVDTMLHALARLPGARGLIVGGHPNEPDLDRLRHLAEALCLGSRVTFTGLVPPHAVAALLSQASILVLPNRSTAISARYASPLKLFEYLGSSRPLVASDLPAFREVLRDGENALLVPPDDPEALAAAVRRLQSEAGLAERLARTAFEEAPGFSWEARASRLEALFDEVRRMRPDALKG